MPEVTFRTITSQTFKLNVEDSETILDLKKRLIEEKGSEYEMKELELLKLIYNGKVLENEATFGEVGFDPARFVVVMFNRKKPEVPFETVAVPSKKTSVEPLAASPAPKSEKPAIAPEQNEKIETIIGMGYTRNQALIGLRLANDDVNQAVTLLLSGIDELDVPSAASDADESRDDDEETNAQAGETRSTLPSLAGLPQIEELQNLIRSNPAAIPEIMRDVAQANPDLMAAISQNPRAFMQLLASGQRNSGASDSSQSGENTVTVVLTPEETEAIQRIKNMGLNVPDGIIIEAFLACEKNEELAISYILDNMEKDDEDM